jgi:hypothetical protein
LTSVEIKALEVIEGTSQLFEGEAKIEEVGNVAAKWLKNALNLRLG